MSTNLQQDYAFNQSSGAVTLPVNASYIEAYAIYLGITEPLNNSWIQAICNHFGITEPLYGSYLIALANYYGITEPVNGSWWYALSVAGAPIPTDLIWDLVSTEWQNEITQWDTGTAPSTPTFDQEGQLLTDQTPTLTGTSDANNTILLTINSITYIGMANGLGVWSIDVTDELPGAPFTGQNYSVDITAKDMNNGLEASIVGSVNILLTTTTITFELRTEWTLYWYNAGMQVEKETSPGVWEAVEWEGNPTWDNGAKFYKVQPFATPGISSGYQTQNVMTFRIGDESGAGINDPIFRDIILDLGFNYRIVAVNNVTPNNPTNYGRFNLYTVYDGATEILPQYDGEDVDWLTGVVQQTFTL